MGDLGRRTAVLTTAIVLTALVGGCSGSGDGADVDADIEFDDALGPLSRMWVTLTSADEDWAQEDVLVEERVAACMAELGFEYTPVDSSLGYELAEPEEVLGTVEYAQLYGYGISTDPNRFEAGGRAQVLAGGPPPDPNEAYVAGMSEAERTAYADALYGPQRDDGEVGDVGAADGRGDGPAEGGCEARARAAVERRLAWQETPGYQLALRGSTEAGELAAADARAAALDERWAECMSGAGHPGHRRPWEPNAEFAGELNAANERAFAGLGPEPTAEQLQAAWAAVDAVRDEIAPREIAVATADAQCRDDVRYEVTLAVITAEYEQEFWDEHAVELEATLAAFQEIQARP